jgi:flagellar biosynthesis protein FliP
MRRGIWGIIGCCTGLLMATQVALAQSAQLPPLQITMGPTPQAGELAIPLQILLLLTLLSFIPALLIAMTSFTRIVIVLSLLRPKLGA